MTWLWNRSSPASIGLSRGEIDRIHREVAIYQANRPAPSRDHSSEFKLVKHLEVSSNPEFEILSDDRVVDLRDWREVPADHTHELFSPVTMTRRIRLLKIHPAPTVEFQGRTTGMDLFMRCLSPYPCVEMGQDEGGFVGPERTKVRKLAIDISSVPEQLEFDLRLSVTYWNSLQTENEQWFGVMGYRRSFKVSQLLLFPAGKPFTGYTLKVAATTKSKAMPYEGPKLLLSGLGRDWIYWEVPDPKDGSVYQLHWTW